jgi:outer membrane protein
MKLRFFVFFFLSLFVLQSVSAQEEVSLEQVVSLALEKSYNVQIAKAVSESAATDNRYVSGAFLPQITATGATVWNNNDQELRFEDAARNNSGTAKSNNINASVQLVWTLFDGTRMFATRERISQIAEQGELAVKEQMVNTISAVVLNYYNIVREKQQLRAIQEQMAVNEERVKLAEKKLQVGTGIKPELLQAQVDLNAQRTQILQQEATIYQLKENLNALVAMQLPQTFDVADTIIIDLNLDESQFQNAQNTNYTLLGIQKNINIANLAIRENKADYLPRFNFNAAYNYSRNDNTQLINPFSAVFSQTDGFNYGFSVTLPILTGFNTRRLVQQSKIELSRQQLVYNQQLTNLNTSVRNALVVYENAKKILLIEEETIGAAKENVFIALESFKRGVTTAIELRTAQQSLADAYNRLITARYNAKVAETELLRLNGSLLK